MFSSNQILNISGDEKDQIKDIIKFIMRYHFHLFSDPIGVDPISRINGMKEVDNSLIFGWIPKYEDGKSFDKSYSKNWDTVFDNPILFNIDILVEIINNWLEQAKYPKHEFEGTTKEGFEFFVDFHDFDYQNIPSFAIFGVRPYYTYYAK